MRKVVKYASFVFNALCWALMASVMMYSNTPLQMWLNLGLLFWGVLVIATVLLIIFNRKNEYGIGIRGSFVSFWTMILVGLVYMGPTGKWFVRPAQIIREGFNAWWPFPVINTILAIVFIVLIGLIIYGHVTDPKPIEENPDADQAKVDRTGRIARWIAFGVLSIVIIVCSCVPSIRESMGQIFAMLGSGDIEAVVAYLRSYGPQAAAVSASLMVLQSLAAPIPAFIITLSNAVVFGWWQGAILSWSSAMIGAALCFFIARILGRDAVAHFVTSGALKTVDKFFDKFGTHAILICRLLPFMSFDYVSYAAGLTSMKFWPFFIATGIGQLPATIVYSYVGGTLTGGARTMFMGLLITFSVAILVFIIYSIFKARNADLMTKEENDSAVETKATDSAKEAEEAAEEVVETA